MSSVSPRVCPGDLTRHDLTSDLAVTRLSRSVTAGGADRGCRGRTGEAGAAQ